MTQERTEKIATQKTKAGGLEPEDASTKYFAEGAEDSAKEAAEKFEQFARATPPPPPPKPLKKSIPGPQPEIIRPVPQKPGLWEKLWIRLSIFSLILIGLAAISTFWYWYFVIRIKPPISGGCGSNSDCPAGYYCSSNKVCVQEGPVKCAADNDCPQNYNCGQDGVCVVKIQEPTPPPSLFSVESEKTLTISSPEELKNLMQQTSQEWLDAGQFKRILIKNAGDNKFLGLKEFSDGMLIRFPEELYQKLDNDFTLFIFSQKEGNRLGFAARIKNNEGLADLLRSKESAMENDLQPFFALMGKNSPAVVSYFRNASNTVGYVGPNFRFQPLTRQDMGICYIAANNYFILSSSLESMKQTISKMAIVGNVIELTSDLKQGNKGDEVLLLQTWLKQDPIVYPQGIVSGTFGALTKAAVIRFQEKYAADILAPQGLLKGTGVVDSYTRIKLNELYSTSGAIPPKPELTTDLRYGDHGNEVKLLQTWLAKDATVYPEKKISSWFGPLTKAAVIRFQEKYKTEVLTPQGLERGTGIVDALTRKKLNDLYGE